MKDIKKLVLFALFAALACVATLVIQIPTPGSGGYIHPGDAIVIICGVFLGPVGGFFTAGIGSSLADVLGGYFLYAPVTFIIKGLIALLTGLLYQKLCKHNYTRFKAYLGVVLGGIFDILLVTLGYGVFSVAISGYAAALTSVVPNLIQGISGLVIGLVLYTALQSVPQLRSLSRPTKTSKSL